VQSPQSLRQPPGKSSSDGGLIGKVAEPFVNDVPGRGYGNGVGYYNQLMKSMEISEPSV